MSIELLNEKDLATYNEKLAKIPNKDEVQAAHDEKVKEINAKYNSLIEKVNTEKLAPLDAEPKELAKFNGKILLAKVTGFVKGLNLTSNPFIAELKEDSDRLLLAAYYKYLEEVKALSTSVAAEEKALAANLKNIETEENALKKWLDEMTEPLTCISPQQFVELKRSFGILKVDENDEPLFSSLEEQFKTELELNTKGDERVHTNRCVESKNTKLHFIKFKSPVKNFNKEYEIKNILLSTLNSFNSKYYFGVGRTKILDPEEKTYEITGYLIINLLNYEEDLNEFKDILEFSVVEDDQEILDNFTKGKVPCNNEEFLR